MLVQVPKMDLYERLNDANSHSSSIFAIFVLDDNINDHET